MVYYQYIDRLQYNRFIENLGEKQIKAEVISFNIIPNEF